MLGCSLSICYMSLNKIASATSITIAGNVNKLVSAVVGAYIFHSKVRANAVVGLLICVAGALIFSFAPKPTTPEENSAEGTGETMKNLVVGATELARGRLDEVDANKRSPLPGP